MLWSLAAVGLGTASWAATLGARHLNAGGRVRAAQVSLGLAPLLAAGSATAFVLAPYSAGLAPTTHVYPAMMWGLAIWAAIHVAGGIIMQVWCLAASFAGKIDPRHDAPLWNITLFWHFLLVTILVTGAVTAALPRML